MNMKYFNQRFITFFNELFNMQNKSLIFAPVKHGIPNL